VAVDARPGRVHQDHAPTSFFRFAGKDAEELSPACVQDRLVRPGFLGNVPAGLGGRAGSVSGTGRVGGSYAMDTFTEPKTVTYPAPRVAHRVAQRGPRQ
jgi:hypothetical protein